MARWLVLSLGALTAAVFSGVGVGVGLLLGSNAAAVALASLGSLLGGLTSVGLASMLPGPPAPPAPAPPGPDPILVHKLERAQEDLARAHTRLGEAQHALMRTEEVRDQFLARMSHELRTPLNAVLGYAEMLEEDLEGEGAEDAGRIRDAGLNLLGLVTSVLDLTQLASGDYQIIPEPFTLAAMFEAVARSVRITAESNQNTLVQEVSPPDLQVELDRRMVQSILFNLADNACKYSHMGTINLRATQGEERVVIEVIDTGIGFTTRQIEESFTPFAQGDESSTRKYDGSGLGLAVCRGFAEAMGGTIQIDSVLGKGATVRISLPLRCEARAPDFDDDEHTQLLR